MKKQIILKTKDKRRKELTTIQEKEREIQNKVQFLKTQF